jgi:hypothetical protein
LAVPPSGSKTWLGLDMALSVATGTACLGKYDVLLRVHLLRFVHQEHGLDA